MKPQELQELVKHITRAIIKEMKASGQISEFTISSSDAKALAAADSNFDTSTPPEDAMTPAEKSRLERQAETDRRKNIRTADMKLKGTKTQTDYFAQQQKQNKLDIIAQEKELQNLKAGKTISSGGAGSLSPS